MAGTAEGTAFSHLIHNSPVSTRSCLPFSRLGHQGAAIGQLTEAAQRLDTEEKARGQWFRRAKGLETQFLPVGRKPKVLLHLHIYKLTVLKKKEKKKKHGLCCVY
uniref:Uncharacterized protein n=1 Tax=Rousettus aegyptiacus TaxID=9407 RepID=A0A7J8FJ09_ROUAE|nr:hypothetical protein HJG63_012010 [Rousettus aegyptiacus]